MAHSLLRPKVAALFVQPQTAEEIHNAAGHHLERKGKALRVLWIWLR